MHKVVSFVLIIVVCTLAARNPGDNHYFAAGTVSWHQRFGYMDFGNDRVEYEEQNLLRTQGIVFGKNIPLPLKLRLSLPLQLEYGLVEDDYFEEVSLTNGEVSDLVLYSKMYHVGIIPLCQIPLRMAPVAWPVFSIGGGLHYVAFIEELRPADNKLKYNVTDDYLEESRKVIFSVTGGGGFEFRAGPHVVFSLQYFFRYWKPVQREMARDLFPYEKIPYAERFFTHNVTLAIMAPRVKD